MHPEITEAMLCECFLFALRLVKLLNFDLQIFSNFIHVYTSIT